MSDVERIPEVGLDAGHGATPTSKRGFVGTTNDSHEGINNYLTCVLMKGYLESNYIVKVHMTRNDVKEYPIIKERVAMFPNLDLLYSFHSNAAESNLVRGTEMWVGSGSRVASALAVELAEATAKIFGHNNRGLKKGDGYLIIRGAKENGAKMAIMGESGFHTNAKDAEILLTKRVEIAVTQAEIIAKHMMLEKKPKPKVIEPVKQDKVNGPYVNERGEKLYFRVIAQSCETRAEAEAIEAALKKAGYPDAWYMAAYVQTKK